MAAWNGGDLVPFIHFGSKRWDSSQFRRCSRILCESPAAPPPPDDAGDDEGVTRSFFLRLVIPVATERSDEGIFHSFDSNLSSEVLAFPLSGGAVTRTSNSAVAAGAGFSPFDAFPFFELDEDGSGFSSSPCPPSSNDRRRSPSIESMAAFGVILM